jgi:hypothetical protein
MTVAFMIRENSSKSGLSYINRMACLIGIVHSLFIYIQVKERVHYNTLFILLKRTHNSHINFFAQIDFVWAF